jgi:hypothetical protein
MAGGKISPIHMLLAVAACAVATLSANAAIQSAERRGEAGIFAGVHAQDGLVRLGSELQALAADPNHRIEAVSLAAARSTLKAHPLNAQVLAALGLDATTAPTSPVTAERFMQLADKVSRREPLSQMWMIESASAAGDVPKALRHYHTILSTQPTLQATLFPILAAAIDFPDVQQAMRPYLRQQSPWVQSFLEFAVTNAKIDGILGVVGQNHLILQGDQYETVNAGIIFRLAELGRSNEALTFAQSVFPDLDKRGFREMGFTTATLDPRLRQMAWVFANDQAATASLTEAGEILITMEPLAKSDVVSRYLMLEPSSGFTFSYDLTPLPGSRATVFTWYVSCVNPTASGAVNQVWAQPVDSGNERGSGVVRFPGIANCSFVRLQLSAIAPDGQVPSASKLSIGKSPQL